MERREKEMTKDNVKDVNVRVGKYNRKFADSFCIEIDQKNPEAIQKGGDAR